MKPEDVIVQEVIFGQRPNEERFSITIQIGKPFPWGGSSPTEWACAVAVTPLSKERETHGEGPLQPLCLALQQIRWIFDDFTERGGLLTWDNGDAWSAKSYWPPKPW